MSVCSAKDWHDIRGLFLPCSRGSLVSLQTLTRIKHLVKTNDLVDSKLVNTMNLLLYPRIMDNNNKKKV